ncbi:MAG: tRNA epoxyqueuosine(34) reductase QueG [Myxococcota bacterium]
MASDDTVEEGRRRAARVKALARDVGFDLCGITGTALPEAYARYRAAMDAGYGAAMGWLADKPELRADARHVWPEARSVIALGVSYASPDVPGVTELAPSDDEAWIARYAQGKDYHLVVKKMLVALAHRLADDPELGHIASERHRCFVDTGPVLEKAFAQAAGLGWIGKSSLLVRRLPTAREAAADHAGPGTWFFLATILTPLELAHDTPETDHCGSCTRCMDVCPTAAFPAPYVLDARRCIATWTIESESPAAVIDPATLGPHVFGCDLCQEVCPYNRRAVPTRHDALRPRPENVRPKRAALASLVAAGEPAFRARFPKSAVRRVTAAQLGETLAARR